MRERETESEKEREREREREREKEREVVQTIMTPIMSHGLTFVGVLL